MRKEQILSEVYLSIILYLVEASLGKIVDMLFVKGILSPTGNPKWTRAAVDKLLANKKYVPIVGVKVYLDAQF